MSRPKLEIVDIFRDHGPAWRRANSGHISLSQLKVMSAIEACRTDALGGHVAACAKCGHQHVAYNSCKNRHCPKCQGPTARDWMAARSEDLLPVEYFHVVFTMPAEIARIAYWNKKAVYGLLFKASAETVMTLAADPKSLGARVGMTSVLHTWGSALTHHPHIHMIVPGGGLSPDGGRWISSRPGFFMPVKVMGLLYRRLFIEGLTALHRKKQSPARLEKSVRLGGAGSSRRFDVVKILKAILEGRIKYGFGEHYHGIRAINFDVSDLRKYEDRQTKSIERAAASKRLMVSLRTIDWLCERRLLKTGCTFSESILANPPIASASLEDFEARFVSLHSLAKSLGLDTTSVLRHANKHGVWAELSATGMTPIFRRSTAWLPSEERLAVGQHFGPQEKSCGEQCKFCGEAETQP